MKPKEITLFLILGLLVIILFQNIESVSIQLLFWQIKMPKIIFILTFFLSGAAVGYWLNRSRW